ncbi:hypothetical protein JOY44_08510 [Phormidium sp. CLA17]|uniref:hypothetical protein n=1 Tax=Leptolyngbya sp. Cla-17 TaxID=2803751 RepID=UPI001932D40F|nr:hypothetical protein [Leptolyngbya sp. Cla-17]MBM0741657.1 hypothetical protein [Leptolyngbya sp. Cla-17]
MPDIDSKYLRGLPSSDSYGDEDGFDMDIDLEGEWTEEDRFTEMEERLLSEYPYFSRSEAGYLCCQLDDDLHPFHPDFGNRWAQWDMERRLSRGFELGDIGDIPLGDIEDIPF